MRTLPQSPTFERNQLHSFGWSDSAIFRAVSRGDLARVRRGHFARAGSVDGRIAAIAAANDRRGSVVSHRSALLLHRASVAAADLW